MAGGVVATPAVVGSVARSVAVAVAVAVAVRAFGSLLDCLGDDAADLNARYRTSACSAMRIASAARVELACSTVLCPRFRAAKWREAI